MENLLFALARTTLGHGDDRSVRTGCLIDKTDLSLAGMREEHIADVKSAYFERNRCDFGGQSLTRRR